MRKIPSESKVLLIAHRGNSHERPENTLAAFEAALIQGVTGIETDIQMSKDGVPVLFHDQNLGRIAGIKKRIGELTLNELKELDIGSWFHPSFHGERMLTLDEFLERFGERTFLCLEIKARIGDDPERSRSLAEKTVEAVAKRKLVERSAIISFNQAVLETVLEKKSGIRTGFITEKKLRLPFSPLLAREDLSALCFYVKILSEPLAKAARNAGKQIYVYPCDAPEEVDHALACGADGIISNKPGWLSSYLRDL